MTVPYAEVIGDPIAHSLSPTIHKFWLARLGIEGDYRATRVTPDALGDYFAARRGDPAWRGCNVTMPHKLWVLDHVDDRDPATQDVGAANCIIAGSGRLVAANTDAWALLLEPGVERFRKRPIVIIGSGGAARAAYATAAGLGATEAIGVARDFIAAVEIARSYGLDGLCEPLAGLDRFPPAGLLINATPLGMAGQDDFSPRLLESLACFPEAATVFDMVYTRDTSLLAAARSRGLEALSGVGMLIEQARRSFELLFGHRPPRDHDRALRELLGR